MIKAQRNMDAGLGYGTSPDQLFASMGMSKTATYDGNGFPVQTENTQPASQAVEAEPLAEPTTTSESELAPEITSISPAPSNEYDLSGKFNGRFKSIDELESYLTEVETKANKDPFANDLVRDLNKAIEQGVDPDLYLAVSQLDVEELSEKEALVLEMQWKKGLSQEDAEFLVERNYKLDSDLDELDMSDPDVREAQIRLKLDAQEAKDFLGQYKKDALVPPAEKLQAELTQAWTPVIPQVMDKWKTFQVTSKSGTYNIPASDAAIQSAQSLLTEVINSGMLDAMPDKDGLAIANAIVEKEIIKIDLQHAIDYVAETLKSKQMEEKHNPRKPQGQTGSPMPSEEQGIIDFLKKVRY
jgi:hypothetical protein